MTPKPTGKWITRKSWKYALCSYCSFEIKKRDENTKLPDECPFCGAKMSASTKNLQISQF